MKKVIKFGSIFFLLCVTSIGSMSFNNPKPIGQYWTCESLDDKYCLTCDGWLFPDYNGIGPVCNDPQPE